MKIEFDPTKDLINREKHGVSLSAASDLDIDRTVIIPDTRRDYGEARYWAVGPIFGRLHIVAFTYRGNKMRIISLRKANAREQKRYDRT